MDVEFVVQLPQQDSGLEHSIIRFHNINIDSSRKNRSKFFRREPLVVVNSVTGKKIMRYAMGNPGTLSIRKNAIAIDYDGVDVLGVSFGPAKLIVRRASRMEVIRWFWMHPDLNVRLSMRFGILGYVIGIVGLLMGLLPFLT